MAKVIDISDKLSFEEKPKIRIKGKEYEVNNDAMSILKALPKLNGNMNPETLSETYELMFSETERKKIDELNLDFADFMTLMIEAVKAAAGTDEKSEGEAQTPATT